MITEDSLVSDDPTEVPVSQNWNTVFQQLEAIVAADARWDTDQFDLFLAGLRELGSRKVADREFEAQLAGQLKKLGAHALRPANLELPAVSDLPISQWKRLSQLSTELLEQLEAVEVLRSELSLAPFDRIAHVMEQLRQAKDKCELLCMSIAKLNQVIVDESTRAVDEVAVIVDGDQPPAVLDGNTEATIESPTIAQLEDETPLAILEEESDGATTSAQDLIHYDETRPISVSLGESNRVYQVNAADVDSRASLGSSAVARVIDAPDSIENRFDLLYALIAEGNWSEGYWLAYTLSLSANAESTEVSASRWEELLGILLATISIPLSFAHDKSFFHTVSTELQSEEERALAFLIATVAYPNTQSSAIRGWLSKRPVGAPRLTEFADYLLGPSLTPVSFDPNDVAACSDLEEKEQELRDIRLGLEMWRENPPLKKESKVWTKLVSRERPLWKLVDSTLNNVLDPPAELTRELQRLQEEHAIKALLKHLDGGAYGPMQTSMLRRLVEEIQSKCSECERYLEISKQYQEATRTVKGQVVNLAEFREKVAASHEAIVAELQHLANSSPSISMSSAWSAGLNLWRWLASFMMVQETSSFEGIRTLYQNKNAILSLHNFERDDEGNLGAAASQDAAAFAIAIARRFTVPLSEDELFNRVNGSGDFRFTDDFRTIIVHGKNFAPLADRLEASLGEIRAKLDRDRDSAEVTVARLWGLGQINESEKAEIESLLVELKRQQSYNRNVRSLQNSMARIDANFNSKDAQLIISLDQELEREIPKLAKHHIDPTQLELLRKARTEIAAQFTLAADQSSALSDLVERVRAAAKSDNTKEAERRLTASESSRGKNPYLSEFLGTSPEASKSWNDKWNKLHTTNKADNVRFADIEDVLATLGIRGTGIQRSPSGVFVGIMNAQATAKSPVPQFGSGLTRLKVVIEMDSSGNLDSVLSELAKVAETAVPSIVFFAGDLTSKERMVRNKQTSTEMRPGTVVVVDRLLWRFLESKSAAERLSALLHCALPFTSCNPFRAFGYVPKELFVGRAEEISDIVRGRSRLLYGGRQFGKSAILQEIQRQLNVKGDTGSKCLMLDLRNKFRTQPTENIWADIGRVFFQEVLHRSTRPGRAEKIIEEIKAWFEEDPSNRLTILADEADSFLQADARSGLNETAKIAALMRQTEDRFQMVFAGTIDVARFANSENNPFAEFGVKAVEVLPVLPVEARQMLEAPLAALGILLDESDIYQILARTNYYPCLIQFVGEKLVDLAIELDPSAPLNVPRNRVARLLQQDSVKRMMIERFSLTLGLSADYKCIIYSLIRKQLNAGLASNAISENAIRGEVSKIWPNRFDVMPPSEFKLIVDELVPMGVLVRDESGYRLRSPNLIPLIGAPVDLVSELEGLERQAINYVHDFHCLVDKADFQFSPLSQLQEILVTRGSHRGTIVLTQEASQWTDLVASLRSNQDDHFDRQVEIPHEAFDDYDLWYRKLDISKSSAASRITFLADLSDVSLNRIPGVMTELVPGVLGNFRTVTYVLGFSAEAAISYLASGDELRAKLEESRELIVARRWTRDQIRLALSDLEFLADYDTGKDVEDATGGWHLLVTNMFREWNRHESVADNLAAFETRFKTSLSIELRNSLGLTTLNRRRTVIILDAEPHRWKDFDVASVTQDGEVLFKDDEQPYELPAEVIAFIEYLIRIDALQVLNGFIEVPEFVRDLCDEV